MARRKHHPISQRFLTTAFLIATLPAAAAAQAEPAQPPPGQQPAAAEPEQHGVRLTDLGGRPLAEVLERVWLTGSARIRPEYQRNLGDFDTSADDELDWIAARFRLGAGADLPGGLGLLLEGQGIHDWGHQTTFALPRTGNEDQLELYQGWFEAREILGTDFSLRLGRQELVYGNELLLGDADFGPGLSHDAVKLRHASGGWTTDLFYGREVDGSVSAALASNADVHLVGLYSSYRAEDGSGLDAYWLFLRADLPAFDERRHTLGVLGYLTPAEHVKVSAEGAWQLGKTGAQDSDIRAFGAELGVEAGLDGALAPRLWAGYGFATGDANPGDRTSETFSPLFQDSHPRLGLSDLFTLSNLHSPHVKATIRPAEGIEVGASYHLFYAHRPEDTVAPGGFQPGTNPDSRFLGQEIDLFVNFEYRRHLTGQLAFAHFIPGGYVRDQLGTRDDAERLYLQVVLAF